MFVQREIEKYAEQIKCIKLFIIKKGNKNYLKVKLA